MIQLVILITDYLLPATVPVHKFNVIISSSLTPEIVKLWVPWWAATLFSLFLSCMLFELRSSSIHSNCPCPVEEKQWIIPSVALMKLLTMVSLLMADKFLPVMNIGLGWSTAIKKDEKKTELSWVNMLLLMLKCLWLFDWLLVWF